MAGNIIHSYPIRLLFLIAAILAGISILILRKLLITSPSRRLPNLFSNSTNP
ncbi:hypothetical protein [Luteolibacter sp. AS25]|uniref:hypothetical protein n=1 Tax=Luteolibacter sp. AS25 TaxID=3135776 RepID=UPI00398A87E1